jgi:hypothetical protein
MLGHLDRLSKKNGIDRALGVIASFCPRSAALMSELVRACGEGLGGLRLCLKCTYQS